MLRRVILCTLLAMLMSSPGFAQFLDAGWGVGIENVVQEFCDDPDIKNLQLPDGINGLAASVCFADIGPVEITERFIGDGEDITGVGFWFDMLGGLPPTPTFVVRIYLTAGGCPGAMVYEHECDALQGGGTGDVSDPVEYFCDFSDAPFYKEPGVDYSISVSNANCPGAFGASAFWATAAGDGLHGCIIAPDFGFPNWTPVDAAGYPWDFAMYLCNAEGPPTATEQSTWGAIKSLYR